MILIDIEHEIEENCSAGCPCNDFECTATTPAPDLTTATVPATTTSPTSNAVLVLSTRNSNNKPMIVDFEGRLKDFILRELILKFFDNIF